jgi:hypothetical protein
MKNTHLDELHSRLAEDDGERGSLLWVVVMAG